MIHKDAEILLDFLIDSLCLSISLWVEGHGGVWSDVEHSIEFFHELGDKLWATVRYDYLGHAIAHVYMISEDSGPSFSREFDVTGDGNDGLRESVNNHEQRIVTVRVGKASDHVDRDVSPEAFRDCIWVERCSLGLHATLCLLTSLAAFDVGFDILLHLWPPVLPEY